MNQQDKVVATLKQLEQEDLLNEIKAMAIEEMIMNMKRLLDDEGRLFDYEILDYAYIVRTNGMEKT